MSPVEYELGFSIPEEDILQSHYREILKSYKWRGFVSRSKWGKNRDGCFCSFRVIFWTKFSSTFKARCVRENFSHRNACVYLWLSCFQALKHPSLTIYIKLTLWSWVPLERPQDVQPLGSSQHFMEPEDSLPSLQELSTCNYPEPNQSSPQHSILSLKGPS
jgi:hypothetical protein